MFFCIRILHNWRRSWPPFSGSLRRFEARVLQRILYGLPRKSIQDRKTVPVTCATCSG